MRQPSSLAGFGIVYAGLNALIAKDYITGIGMIMSGIGAILVPESGRHVAMQRANEVREEYVKTEKHNARENEYDTQRYSPSYKMIQK
jgi:hypothetical protein